MKDLERYARWALEGLFREEPYLLVHLFQGAGEIGRPRQVRPVFFGCYDWHSAVHSHWSLVRVLRRGPGKALAEEIGAALERSLSTEGLAGEARQLRAHPGFERPYGLAWLLLLALELREWRDERAAEWYRRLEPLESIAAERFAEWLPRLPWPIRSGEHSQSAFALGLVHDWCRGAGRAELEELLVSRSLRFYGEDRDAPLAYEPSGHDFLSPVLAEADLLRRFLPPEEFASWLDGFFPPEEDPTLTQWLRPVASPDVADGKLSHLEGLNLSRAWMLEGIVAGLPDDHPRRPFLRARAEDHRRAGLAITGEHYVGSHWLGSFAVYLLTERGLRVGGDDEE